MTDDSGLLLGEMVGRHMAEGAKAASDHATALAELRSVLKAEEISGLMTRAFAQAAADVSAEIVREIAGKAPRQLSDPSNVIGRNQHFAERSASHVNHLSKGAIRWGSSDLERITRQKPLK